MRKAITWVLLIAVTAITSFARAEDTFDPAACAKVITPYIEEQTVAVVHVDLSRITIEPLLAQVKQWLPVTDQELQTASAPVVQGLVALRNAGAKELYFLFSLTDMPRDVEPVIVVTLDAKADEKAVVAVFGPPPAVEHRGSILVMGSRAAVDRLSHAKPDPRPELARALAAGGDGPIQALLLPPKYAGRVVQEMMPTLPEIVGGGPSTVLTRGILWAAVGIDLTPDLAARLVIQSADHEAAVAVRTKWIDVVRLLGQHPDMRKQSPWFELLATLLMPEVQEDRLVLVVDKSQKIPALMKLLTPALESAREQAQHTASASNLRQIGLAMHVYAAEHKSLPSAASRDVRGKPLLSWRVQLLPYLGQEALYKQFRLDEPWDSQHNRPLVEKMPAIYRSPLLGPAVQGQTTYLALVGKTAAFLPDGEGSKIADFKDSLPRLILVVEADDAHAVPWTKPEDLTVDPDRPTNGLAKLPGNRFPALFGDGHVELISREADPKSLRAMMTRPGK